MVFVSAAPVGMRSYFTVQQLTNGRRVHYDPVIMPSPSIAITVGSGLVILATTRQVGAKATNGPGEATSRGTSGSRHARQLEQPCCICTGGHFTDPYEQNTQQSPAEGRSTALQRSHS